MDDEPEDERAKAHSAQGLTRELQVIREELPDPSRGGCRGYPVWLRREMLEKAVNGEQVKAHYTSLRRWEAEGVHAKRMAGNKQKETVTGFDQFLLAFYILVYPDFELDEAAAFIYNNGGGVYSRQDLFKRLKELDVTRKKASTEAYQAFLPHNVLRTELFFSEPLPLGISGIPRRKFADFEEFGVAVQQTNRSDGYSHSSIRIRKAGHYCRDTKLTVLFGVEPGDPRLPNHVLGSIGNPRRWIRVLRAAGTTAVAIADFMESVIEDIEGDPIPDTDDHRVFLWDNRRSHLNPIVTQTVEGRHGPCRFSILPRPAYQAKYGPIEYKICDLVSELRRQAQPNWNTDILEQAVLRIAGQIGMNGSVDNTFDHCGYTFNGL
jgi:hypothetical protein